MNRILVIRGGAIGDFILTLPALKALRDARPQAHMEILGYKHIAVLAENRFYAQGVHSIEYGPLARFFARNSELPTELADYFASFDLIVSYLYDPDLIFESNLRRCGVQNLICGPARIVESAGHAARQLARPMEQLGINVADFAERIFPLIEDREFAREFLASVSQPIIAIHPGSGSHEKNWPLENWIDLFSPSSRFARLEGLVVISGEADETQIELFVAFHSKVVENRNLKIIRLDGADADRSEVCGDYDRKSNVLSTISPCASKSDTRSRYSRSATVIEPAVSWPRARSKRFWLTDFRCSAPV